MDVPEDQLGLGETTLLKDQSSPTATSLHVSAPETLRIPKEVVPLSLHLGTFLQKVFHVYERFLRSL